MRNWIHGLPLYYLRNFPTVKNRKRLPSELFIISIDILTIANSYKKNCHYLCSYVQNFKQISYRNGILNSVAGPDEDYPDPTLKKIRI